MTDLAEWLQAEMDARGLSQSQLSVHAGVALGTVNKILRQDHIPKIDTLFRLADYLGTDHLEILTIAGRITRADHLPEWKGPVPKEEDDHLTWQLLQEFRRIPDPYKPDAINQLRLIARLTKRPKMNIIGDESDEEA